MKKNKSDEHPVYSKYFIFKLFLLALCIYALLVVFTVDKPVTLDEAAFSGTWKDMHDGSGISALSQTSEQSYQYKNLNHQLAHPPLWRLLVYWFTSIFGLSNITMRLFGVIMYLVTFVLLYRLITILNQPLSDKLFFLAATILLVHPFLAVSSMAIHIDTMMIAPVFLLFMYYFIKKSPQTLKELFFFAVLFALAFWTKELLAFFIAAAIFCNYLVQKDIKSAFLKTSIIVLFGTIIFTVTWVIFAYIFNIPPEGWFYETIWQKIFVKGGDIGSGTSLLSYIFLVGSRGVWKLLFYSLPFVILLGLSFWNHFKNKERNTNFDILYIFVFIQGIFFTFIFFSNTYYLFTAMIVGVFLIVKLIYDLKLKIHKNSIYWLGGLFVYYLCLGNPAVLAVKYWLQTRAFGTNVILPDAYTLVFILFMYFLPVVVMACVFLFNKHKRNVLFLARVCLIIFVASSFSLNIYQLDDHVTATLWNNYGETHMGDTIDFMLESEYVDGTIVITRKDLEYYLRDTFTENDITYVYNRFLRHGSKESVDRGLEGIDLDEVSVITTDIYVRKSNDYLLENFTLVFTDGDFAVYHNTKLYNLS